MSRLLGRLADVVPFSWVDGPGNRFTVFLQGCNLDCVACHNPQTIPLRTPRAMAVTAGDLLERVRPLAPFLSGVTVSGGEATVQEEFVRAWFEALRDDPATAGLTRFVDSNGCADRTLWERLLPVTDGVMLDLKALDDDVHRRLTGSGNAQVLASLDLLVAADRLAEVRLLVVPGYNDDPHLLARTGDYLREHAPGVPVRVIGFRPHGVRASARGIPEPSAADRARFRDLVAGAHGGVVTVV